MKGCVHWQVCEGSGCENDGSGFRVMMVVVIVVVMVVIALVMVVIALVMVVITVVMMAVTQVSIRSNYTPIN